MLSNDYADASTSHADVISKGSTGDEDGHVDESITTLAVIIADESIDETTTESASVTPSQEKVVKATRSALGFKGGKEEEEVVEFSGKSNNIRR